MIIDDALPISWQDHRIPELSRAAAIEALCDSGVLAIEQAVELLDFSDGEE